jgi:hypothetical protein
MTGQNVFPFHRAFRNVVFNWEAKGRAAEAIARVAPSYYYPIAAANDRDHFRW